MLIEMSFVIAVDGTVRQLEPASQDDDRRILSQLIIGTTQITILTD